MIVTTERDITTVITQTITVDVSSAEWLDTVEGQDWLDDPANWGDLVERLVDVVDATPWRAARPAIGEVVL